MSQATQQWTEEKRVRLMVGLLLAAITAITFVTVEWLTQHTPDGWMWIWTGSMECGGPGVTGVCGVFPVGIVVVVFVWAAILGLVQRFRTEWGDDGG